MSAILSADDLNDFISPGVACIKPVETLPKQHPRQTDEYEVAKEGQSSEDHKPAQISLTDCLACSGCVTSAEAVLVSLQSHAEVLNTLDTEGKLFVASVSPQVRASIAATYGVTEEEAGHMICQLLGGSQGLAKGGKYGNCFQWVVDTNAMREVSLVLGSEEILQSSASANDAFKRPILSSACPGWICYAEKTHPHVLPHLSRLKSPQALTGTLLKTVLSKSLNLHPDQIWHVAVMPCFDKKLEASREELTDIYWGGNSADHNVPPVRDVDCVITSRELLMLADTRGISFPNLPRKHVTFNPFPDPTLNTFLFPYIPSSPRKSRSRRRQAQRPEAGTSGGYLYHILQTQLSLYPNSSLTTTRGRNADVVEYVVTCPSSSEPVFKAARYYGFRNIQNLVRKLKPAKKSRMPGVHTIANKGTRPGGAAGLDYAYVEVMACPGGCTNGGGQIKVDDLPGQQAGEPSNQKEWLGKVDEAYYSMDSDRSGQEDEQGDLLMSDGSGGEELSLADDFDDEVNGISPKFIHQVLKHWEEITGIPLEKLVTTMYRKVESDVGKVGGGENDRVVELAGKIGGGW